MDPKEFLKGKKVLVMGLGLLGGGVATAKWLLKVGAEVTVTDSKNEVELELSLKKFTSAERKKLKLSLGGHKEKDFSEHDIVVVNPAVPKESPYIAIAKKAGKQIENDASFFFRFAKNGTIGVTGTRGKTTITNWIASMLATKHGEVCASGNTPQNAFLKEMERTSKTNIPAVAELSSWQLETMPASEKAPHVAVITNLFPDHLNRYKGGIEEYAAAKANIFKHQTENDFLILNADNEWTPFFLMQKPKAKIYYFSKKSIKREWNGVFVKNDKIIFRENGVERELLNVKGFAEKMGEHNMQNLLATVLAVTLFEHNITPSTPFGTAQGGQLRINKKMIDSLPQVPFRQEIIFSARGLMVVNDSAGTSPDAVIAAIRRFSNSEVKPLSKIILITGGTDKDLQFSDLAKEIKKSVPMKNLILLNGSATQKLIKELDSLGSSTPKSYETLDECVNMAFAALPNKKGIIVFSPGAASFEKFKNEFDRGEKFAAAIQLITMKK
jgi:UDP-N-acetylmuramoylalanine--D-glutamate ligase